MHRLCAHPKMTTLNPTNEYKAVSLSTQVSTNQFQSILAGLPPSMVLEVTARAIDLPWLHGWWSETKAPTHSGSRTHSATELLTSGYRVEM